MPSLPFPYPPTWAGDTVAVPTYDDVLPTSLSLSWDQYTPVDDNGYTVLYTSVFQYEGDTDPGYPWDGDHRSDTPFTTDTSRDLGGLNPGVLYNFSAYTQWTQDYNGTSYQFAMQSAFSSIATPTGAWIRDGGIWKVCTPYVRTEGEWKMVLPHVRVAGVWQSTD